MYGIAAYWEHLELHVAALCIMLKRSFPANGASWSIRQVSARCSKPNNSMYLCWLALSAVYVPVCLNVHFCRHCPADLFSLVTAFSAGLQTRLHEKCVDWWVPTSCFSRGLSFFMCLLFLHRVHVWCKCRNNHPVRPQKARGIRTYFPIRRFMPAVHHLQR